MSKLDGKSMDILEENIQQLQQLFPEIITDGQVNFDMLKQVLGDYTDNSNERYNFSWNGKGQALRNSQTPSMGTLRPNKEESKDWDSTENLYIEGDNLEVLKLLQKSYFGKVKMIYIDPPYNTGGDFVYKDDFKDSLKNYKEITGQVDGNGNATTTNREYSGRYHTDWLNMMYPRLRLARNLLTDDGVIFISIDDNEQANLKKLCDEVFGEENFRNTIQTRRYDKNINRQFMEDGLMSLNVGLESILVYSKNQSAKLSPVFRKSSAERSTTGYWKGFWNNADRPTMRYDVLGAMPESGQWKWREELADEAVSNYVEYMENHSSKMTIEDYWEITGKSKRFLQRNLNGKGMNQGVVHWVAPAEGILRTSNWSDLLASKPTGVNIPFDSPKNYDVISELFRLGTLEPNDYAMDFFSGSSTTAHAVMQLNAEDGGTRKFIMVQLPEETDEKSEAYKAGYTNIAEIGKERIRRAGEQIKKELVEKHSQQSLEENTIDPKSLDIGFKVLKLDTSNIRPWNPSAYEDIQTALADNVSPYVSGRTEQDVVFELMLKMGLSLTYPIEEYKAGTSTIYSIGFGALMICLSDTITMETANKMNELYKKLAPETWRVVCRDEGFATDSDKTNVKETLKSAGLSDDAFITL